MKSYYQVLGVAETATDAEIKKAFRKIARDNHPDTHPGNTDCEARFKEANEAYETLGDAEKRKKYDQRHKAKRQGQKKGKATPGAGNPFDFANMNMNFDDMFSDMFTAEDEKKREEKSTADKPKAEKNPLDVDDLFAKFMGFKP